MISRVTYNIVIVLLLLCFLRCESHLQFLKWIDISSYPLISAARHSLYQPMHVMKLLYSLENILALISLT